MYTIIGGDGKEYGPVTAGQIRAWMAAGRANLQTKARMAGTEEWKELEDFPEFNGSAVEPAEPAPPAEEPEPIPAGADARTIANSMIARAAQVDIASCYERSWRLLREQFWPLVGTGTLIFAISEVAGRFLVGNFTLDVSSLTPRFFAGITAASLLRAVLWGGLEYYILKKIRREPTEVGDAFSGFSQAFVPLLLSGLVTSLLSAAGFFLLILPGIYLWVGYRFAYILILDRKLGFWTAMEVSRRVVAAQWWRILGVTLLAIPFLLLGLFVFLVGALVAQPLVIGALLYAYEDLCNPRRE